VSAVPQPLEGVAAQARVLEPQERLAQVE